MKDDKRILFLSCWNPSREHPQNGIFIRRHAEALKDAGYAVDFLAVNIRKSHRLLAVEYTENDNELELHIHSVAWKFIYTLYPLLLWIIKNHLIRHLNEKKYTHVVSNVIHPTAVIGAYLSKRLSIPHAIIEHFSKTDFLLRHWLFGKRLKNIYAQADLVIPVSSFLERIIKGHVPQVKTHIIPNVVDTSTFGYLPGLTDGSKTLKFVAVAHWHQTQRIIKRPDLIIAGLQRLKEVHADLNIELEFIGSGNMLDQMRAASETCDFKTTFSGTQDSTYISKALNQVSFFLHASTIETFSVVTVEALCCGTPVIASNVGALPDLISDGNGLLAENTVEAWSKAIEKAIQCDFDRQKIAEATKQKYSPRIVGESLGKAVTLLR